MPHTNYPSLVLIKPNGATSDKRATQYLDENKSQLFHVSEKIHGANMCLETDGVCVEVHSRNRLLPPEEYSKFHHAELLIANLTEGTIRMFHKCRESDKTLVTLRIYGEIHGGFYPDHERQQPTSKPVQPQILYCKEVTFRAFNIQLQSKTNVRWTSRPTTNNLCKLFGIPFVPILFEGTWDQCFEYSSLHLCDATTIPQLEGLQPLSWATNLREGRPLTSMLRFGVLSTRTRNSKNASMVNANHHVVRKRNLESMSCLNLQSYL